MKVLDFSPLPWHSLPYWTTHSNRKRYCSGFKRCCYRVNTRPVLVSVLGGSAFLLSGLSDVNMLSVVHGSGLRARVARDRGHGSGEGMQGPGPQLQVSQTGNTAATMAAKTFIN